MLYITSEQWVQLYTLLIFFRFFFFVVKGFANECSCTQGVKVSSQVRTDVQRRTSALNQLRWRFDPPDLGVITGCCIRQCVIGARWGSDI